MKHRLTALGLGLAFPAFGWTLIAPKIDGWAARPLVVYVNPSGCTISDTDLYAEVDRAIAVWNQIPASGLTMVRSAEAATATPAEYEAGTATQLPVIFCEADFDGKIGSADFVPAACASRVGTGPLTSSAIYLNVQPGSGAEISQLDIDSFRIALTHEMGHMLGLGHSAASTSLMYYSVSGKSTARITEDDRMGIIYLYPRNEFAAGTFGCAAVHGTGTAWSLLAALLYLAALLVGTRWLRSGKRYKSFPAAISEANFSNG